MTLVVATVEFICRKASNKFAVFGRSHGLKPRPPSPQSSRTAPSIDTIRPCVVGDTSTSHPSYSAYASDSLVILQLWCFLLRHKSCTCMHMPSYLHWSRTNTTSLHLHIELRYSTQQASDMILQIKRDFITDNTSHASSDIRQLPIWKNAMLMLSTVLLFCFLPPNKHSLL